MTRYLLFLIRQVVGYSVATRRPGLLLVLVLGSLGVLVGLAVQLAAPVAIYPFI